MSYKLLTCETKIGPRVGVLIGDRVYSAEKLSDNPAYQSMLGILQDWDAADAFFSGQAESGPPGDSKALADVRILPPILYPGEIWAAGANYQDHISEIGDTEYRAVNAKTVAGGRPWHFSKSSRGAIVGHATVNPLPWYSRTVDWEIELAVVIGRPAYRVSAADALNYVAGYTISNDLSARDFVARPGIDPASPFRYDWLSHKGFQGACPMGPYLTPGRYVSDPQNLDMKLWIGDELMQASNTKYMIFSIAEQIEEISARVTMLPGDVLMTGTPSGVGISRGRWLQSGEHLRLWIEGLGELHHGFC
jgi:2-keto-4-pentenoate hydratase/2-oxohepta-3-ene-1,7-dioic acid hydratase in catechol pathway